MHVQAGQAYGGPLGLPAAQAAVHNELHYEHMSEHETMAWLMDLAGTCPLADLAARGIPRQIDRCNGCCHAWQEIMYH